MGVRFNQERLPAYDPVRFPSLEFGLGKKIAPRIGAAYDLLHNGKIKVFASYGQFYDTMKMGLARGSFGSDYWHQCVYALDTPNFSSIVPTDFSGDGGAFFAGISILPVTAAAAQTEATAFLGTASDDFTAALTEFSGGNYFAGVADSLFGGYYDVLGGQAETLAALFGAGI